MNRAKPAVALLAVALIAAQAQNTELAAVVSKPVSRSIELPGELLPFLTVSLHAKVSGYVERILVDRGSQVNQGDLLAELSAPEIQAQIAEAESKVQAAESDRLQAEAQLAAARSTSEGLKKAAETPGAVAGIEVIQAARQVEAAEAVVRAREQASQAARSAAGALKDLEAYLKITAPFTGVVTERLVHPGALVGADAGPALLILQQISHLRLVVAVPEEVAGSIVSGATVEFRVPAFPERTYSGKVARIAHALDPKTRTEPVELDVFNRDNTLAPGMYPSVRWPVHRSGAALFVPRTAVVSTTERTFVVRDRNGRAEWVDVKKGAADGDQVEVMGDLHAGDLVVRRPTDELREGTPLNSAR